MSAIRTASQIDTHRREDEGSEAAAPLRRAEAAEAELARLRRRADRLQRQLGAVHEAGRQEVARRQREIAAELQSRLDLAELRGNVFRELREAAVSRLGAVSSAAAVSLALPPVPSRGGGSGGDRPSWRQRRAIRERLRATGLFDAHWYRRTYLDAASLTDRDALEHFLEVGVSQDRDPHPLISSSWIRGQQGKEISQPPILAFLSGRLETPHPLFDPGFYRRANPDIAASGDGPFLHYIRHGAAERRAPHPAFDPIWFERGRGSGVTVPDLLVQYLDDPAAYNIDPHPLFRTAFYVEQVPAARDRRMNPLLHYVVQGWRLGLAPHPLFDTAYYLAAHPDVAAADLVPLSHFLDYGGTEGRRPHPLFDPRSYLDENPDVTPTGQNPLHHYVIFGAKERRKPRADFPLREVERLYPDLDAGRVSPPEALLYGRDGAGLPAASPVGPAPDRYWLPDRLREYVAERHGEVAVARVADLMEIVDRHTERPRDFGSSPDHGALAMRLRQVAGPSPGDVPDASIIVPVHNALVYTMTSLLSVLEAEHRSTYEVLVADDASTDETAATFAELGERVRHIRSDRTLGFLGNCNQAARQARGRHLVFLNNDTIVLPGWLDELVDTLDSAPHIGLVGSKFLNADGTLQEAGGIIWRDGSAWNYGRGGHPGAPPFNYAKDVDYLSGASIATPSALWRELGGFDPLYAPAYCEDSDYAFRVRAAGRRSVYQPFSEVIHHEGRSHGRDTTKSVKAYQIRNGERLRDRWATVLQREHLPPGEALTLARDRSRDRPHLVIIDHYVPQWESDAGSRTMFHFIRLFVARGFQVSFWSDNLFQDPTYTPPLQRMGVEVIYGPDYVGRFRDWFAERAESTDYVLLSRPHIASGYVDALREFPAVRLLYYGHDVHWLRALSEYEVTKDPATLHKAETVRSQEIGIMEECELAIFPSETEREVVQAALGDRTEVVAVPAWVFSPAELEAAETKLRGPETGDQRRLLFVGGFTHGPNADGVVWFAREVLPRILDREPTMRLVVVGSNAPDDVLALANDSVEVLGRLSDEALAEEYRRAAVAVAPLRFGGGVKGKVIEAFAKGVPVVSTSIGMQGVPDADDVAFVADKPADFADAVLHAVRDRATARAKAERALAFLRRDYSPDALAARLSVGIPELAPGQAPAIRGH
ncbi:MAG: glycosyltransferase [Methylobacteriaceae bacterium]|nr:glycosyltransferase [Methylobacteriaceae bacterium]